MVADIAAVYGQQAALRQELMVYCLFKHGAAHLARELVVRVGQRYLVKQATRQVLQGALQKIGVNVTQRVLGKSISRYVPVLGALAIGAYAYYDTAQVAKTAIETFSRPVVDGADGESGMEEDAFALDDVGEPAFYGQVNHIHRLRQGAHELAIKSEKILFRNPFHGKVDIVSHLAGDQAGTKQ